MNHSRLTMSLTALAASGLLAVTGCSATPEAAPAADCEPVAEFETIVPGTLTVAAVQQLPGIDIDPTTGEVSGLDGSLLTAFAEENCLETDFQALAGAAAVAAMTEGRADIGGGGWYRTEARGEVLGQTQPLWYDQVGVVSAEAVDSIDDLQGMRVGIVGGSLFEEPLIAAIGADSVAPYQSIDAIFEDLAAGRIDAAMGAGATLTIQVADRDADLSVNLLEPDDAYPVLTAAGEPNYPYTKTNEALGAALEEFIDRARDEGMIADALAEHGVDSEFALEGPAQ